MGRWRKIFHPLADFRNACQSPGKARQKPGAGNSTGVSMWVAGTPTLGLSPRAWIRGTEHLTLAWAFCCGMSQAALAGCALVLVLAFCPMYVHKQLAWCFWGFKQPWIIFGGKMCLPWAQVEFCFLVILPAIQHSSWSQGIHVASGEYGQLEMISLGIVC